MKHLTFNIIKVLLLALCSILCNCTIKENQASRVVKSNFNQNWKFKKQKETTETKFYTNTVKDGNWETVSLPHTAQIEPLIIKEQQWQGTSWYRKTFKVNPEYKGKHLALYFEGAMQESEVWLNGKKIAYHKGGYSFPFH